MKFFLPSLNLLILCSFAFSMSSQLLPSVCNSTFHLSDTIRRVGHTISQNIGLIHPSRISLRTNPLLVGHRISQHVGQIHPENAFIRPNPLLRSPLFHNPLLRNPLLVPGRKRCYGNLGCFPIDGRFQSVLRPINVHPRPPEKMRVEFLLYTRSNPDGPQLIKPTIESIRSSYFRKGVPVKFITHGYGINSDLDWIRIARKEFLRIGDMNVIIVDWRYPAFRSPFQAVADIRVIGAMMAEFVNFLNNSFSVPSEMVHLIGHSLGSQMIGYAGERIKNLGRITGLDPAQPYFENTHPAVYLDPSDALFVDVIHTDSRPIFRGGATVGPPCGHVDFYPNGGELQAGCRKPVAQKFVDENFDPERVGLEFFVCNHARTPYLFIESLKATCPEMAVKCSSYADFRKGRCFDCGSKGENCAPLGYYSEQWFQKFGSKMNLPVKMYLMTGTTKPLCRYHHRVKIRTTSNLERNSAFGRLVIRFTEAEGSTRIHLHKKELKFQPVSTYMFVIVSRSAEPLKEIVLEWQPTQQTIHQHIFSTALGSKNILEIANIEIDGLETRYRCTFPVDAIFTPRDRMKTLNSEKCEDISSEDNKIIMYPLSDSQFPGNSSSAGSLNKGNFIPKPTIIPQPLFKKRNEALSYLLDPFIERLFSKSS